MFVHIEGISGIIEPDSVGDRIRLATISVERTLDEGEFAKVTIRAPLRASPHGDVAALEREALAAARDILREAIEALESRLGSGPGG
jgi:hypothetical protein